MVNLPFIWLYEYIYNWVDIHIKLFTHLKQIKIYLKNNVY